MSRGMYCTQCEAQGFRKITYWPDRPDVMTTFRVRIEGGRARCCSRTATSSRQGPGWAEWEDPFRKPSYLFALVAGDLVGGRGPLRHALGARGAAADLGAAGRRGPLRLRHGRAEAGDGLGRARIRAGVRPRPVHDRGGRRLQHGGDGEQGAQRLQLALRAGEPRDGDRRRLQVDRDDHRARVFPQLDRQPDHLPRLVPALPQGGADGLPRPAVLGRPAQRGGEADRGRAALARERSSARMPGRWRIRSGRRNTSRSTTSIPRRSTRRAPRSSACCAAWSARRPTRRRSTSISSGTTAQACTIEDWLEVFEDASGRDLAQFKRWYSQAGTPRLKVSDDWDGARYRLSSRRRRRRRRASRRSAAGDPGRLRAARPGRRDDGRGGARARRGGADLRVGAAGAAGAVAAARLLGAGDPRAGGRSRPSGPSCSPTTATPSTSGRPGASSALDPRWRGWPPTRRRRRPRLPRGAGGGGGRRRPRPGVQGAGARRCRPRRR